MFLNELFARDGVTCPNWLSNVVLENEWINSHYVFEDNVHKWSFKNQFKNVLITFDNTEYHFIAYSSNGEILCNNIITESETVTC